MHSNQHTFIEIFDDFDKSGTFEYKYPRDFVINGKNYNIMIDKYKK